MSRKRESHFSRSGRTNRLGKCDHDFKVWLDEQTYGGIVCLASDAGVPISEYARFLFQTFVLGHGAMLQICGVGVLLLDIPAAGLFGKSDHELKTRLDTETRNGIGALAFQAQCKKSELSRFIIQSHVHGYGTMLRLAKADMRSRAGTVPNGE